MSAGKLIILSAPSGSGKTTLVQYLMQCDLELEFSVSACTRPKRPGEIEGKDYYFLSQKDFKNKIDEGAFIEWEEVYDGRFYGTLKSEVSQKLQQGKKLLFDVDVLGGLNIKKQYPDQSLAVFIKVPSLKELENRLKERGTDHKKAVQYRIEKAARELKYADKFDHIIMNEQLEKAKAEMYVLVKKFIEA